MSADIPYQPNRATKILQILLVSAAVIAIIGSVSRSSNSSEKKRSGSQEERIYSLKLPPPCSAEVNSGKVLEFEDGSRICKRVIAYRRTSRQDYVDPKVWYLRPGASIDAGGPNVVGATEIWWWSHQSITADVEYFVDRIDPLGVSTESGENTTDPYFVPSWSDEDSSWTWDTEEEWVGYHNGREYVNDPWDTWGDGR